jgi:hypothetical protein
LYCPKKCYYHDERKECKVGETCNTQGEMKNEYKIVAGKNVDARHAGEK